VVVEDSNGDFGVVLMVVKVMVMMVVTVDENW
jgi:hypothetical protein